MSGTLTLPRAINVIRETLKDPSFNFDSLKECIKKGELGLMVKLDNPSVFFVETNNPRDLFNPDQIYELKESVMAYPVEPYVIERLVPRIIVFEWQNTIYKLWDCKGKQWVIKQSDLDTYLESKKLTIIEKTNEDKLNSQLQVEPDWDNLAYFFYEGRGRLLVWALQELVASDKQYELGDVSVVRDWILKHSDQEPFKPHEIKKDGKSLLIKPAFVKNAGYEKWRSDKISESWDRVKGRYVESLAPCIHV